MCRACMMEMFERYFGSFSFFHFFLGNFIEPATSFWISNDNLDISFYRKEKQYNLKANYAFYSYKRQKQKPKLNLNISLVKNMYYIVAVKSLVQALKPTKRCYKLEKMNEDKTVLLFTMPRMLHVTPLQSILSLISNIHL